MNKLAAVIILFGARVAAAQPSMTPPSTVPPGPPPPPPPVPGQTQPPADPLRHGVVVGADLGFGGMSSRRGYTDCNGCDGSSAASLSAEIGAMISPRAALMLGFQLTAKPGTPPGAEPQVTHGQTVVMIEGAYWTSRRMWISGGLGSAHLSDACDLCTNQDLDHGLALEAGIGYELISSQRFALDARFRLMAASYKNLDDTVTTPTLAVGIRWF